VIRRRLSHIAPEELVLIPIVIGIVIVVLAQPSAITRLFESPYATPVPGDSPAERFLRERELDPVPTASPATAPIPGPRIQTAPASTQRVIVVNERAPLRILTAPSSGR